MAAKIYTNKDANIASIKRKKLAVIGFGSQGHAHALNLKDSGCDVTIGLYKQSKSRAVARRLGFKVVDTNEAVKTCDVLFIATPDSVIRSVYEQDIAPHLRKGQTLLFAHGFAIHFKTITPPANIDVIMVAPKGAGQAVRSQYTDGKGVPALIAIHQDATGNAKKTALAWAKGIGATRVGVFETNFREETITDLFSEQTILCGGVSNLIMAGFEVLVEAGYQPEMAYFECLHELKFTVDLIHERGITGMRDAISDTAEYGDLTVGSKIINESVKNRMRAQLKRIEKGQFAKAWIAEYENGCKDFDKIRKDQAKHSIEKVGKKLRATMHRVKR